MDEGLRERSGAIRISRKKTNEYDILNEITEIRTCCGFRENMIQVANRPCDEVALNGLFASILNL